ncbi:MAG: hypothetical protein H6Q10_2485, partial [Acidobacteria bacterium]|nr:hypothetical protein [Acidobacteriota bacterium]
MPRHQPRPRAVSASPPRSRLPRRLRWVLGFGLGFALALAVGLPLVRWFSGASPAVDVVRTSDQNVLLITLDTMRADALGCAGGRAAT